MKKLFSQHPYAVTSVIFLVLLLFGFFHLHWRKDDFMFLLLLYFIVTLGIRLDDICRQLGSDPHTASEQEENVLSTLKEIRSALRETNRRLKRLEDGGHRDKDV